MSKSFQDRIKALEDYRPDVLYKDKAFVLKIKFNDSWQIIKPKDEDVAYAPDDRIKNLHWYVSTIENTDKLFDLIDETIAVNKEFEKKCALYKEKVKELQELFLSDVSYERLSTVQFVFADSDTKPKKKKKTPNKVQKDTENEELGKTEQDSASLENESEINDNQGYQGDIDDAIEKALNEK